MYDVITAVSDVQTVNCNCILLCRPHTTKVVLRVRSAAGCQWGQ